MQLELSPKQNEYILNANRRWNFKIGAVRSGKTFVDMVYMIPSRLRQRHGLAGLNVILGVSKETIERNVLQPMREIYTSDLVGTINNRNMCQLFGDECYCLGAEKVTQVAKIQGASIKYAYGDEIAKWNPEVFAMLQSRLDKPYSCFDGSCNPEYPDHWLKKFIDKPDIDAYIQKYTLFENPFLPKDFVDNLCKEYAGTVYYNRYVLGEWALAEGLVYPMYESVLEEAPHTPVEGYGMSIDYGTRNAFACLLWEKHDGVWYANRGYYYSGRETGKNKTDEDYASDLDDFVAPVWERMQHTGRKLKVIIDPSASSFITLLQRRPWASVIPAVNDVADGIRDTASCMQRGLIKVNPNIKEWVEEARGYIWDDERGIDAPVKERDHYMDATRYWVTTNYLARHKSIYIPLYG